MTVDETAQRPAGALCRFLLKFSIFHLQLCSIAEYRLSLSKRVEKCRTKVEWFDKIWLHFPGKSVIFDNGVAISGVF